MYDVAIIGGGPAGATCATLCASQGRSVLLLERSQFPRDKVCGDCLNPLAWIVLEQLGLRERTLFLPHSVLEGVRFIGTNGLSVRVPLPHSPQPELGISRSQLDQLLLTRAREAGVIIHENTPLKKLRRLPSGWQLECDKGVFEAQQLVAADGRNSTVARQLGLLPPPLADDRIAVQTHLPQPACLNKDVVLQFVREGYAGLAPIGNNLANLCLVSRPRDLAAIKSWATAQFDLSEGQTWRSIAPLRRMPLAPTQPRLWLTGDTAQVVEPFTGEGIAYALRTGALCAEALLLDNPALYATRHAALYRGRLWVNHLARWACLNPKGGSALLLLGRVFPPFLQLLTRKVVAKQPLLYPQIP